MTAAFTDVSFFPRAAKPLTSYKPYWARRFGTAPFLPMSRAEMDALGWDCCDVILVTGDAYVDHPSFGMAVIGRVLEAQGFRVGIIAQPDWQSADAFKALGKPNLFWGVTAGNMDSMINRYTADRKIRSDDAYTPGDEGGKRPDRAAIVYSQRCREAFKDVPIVLGGIEGSLRRIAHYDYWSDKVRRSIVVDSKCDILLYGNAERALVEVAHRLARREPVEAITDVRGTAFVRRASEPGWTEIDSTEVDQPGRVDEHINPYQTTSEQAAAQGARCEAAEDAPDVVAGGARGKRAGAGFDHESGTQPLRFVPNPALAGKASRPARERTVIRLPSYEQVRRDAVLYAHANRVLHLETNPGNARALVQAHGEQAGLRDVWLNPPPVPLTTPDGLGVRPALRAQPASALRRCARPARRGHQGPRLGDDPLSVNIMRRCFGGCTFCSITEHEGRIIQSRSEDSIVREVEEMRDKVQGFTGVVSDLGGPTANMYRLGCRSPRSRPPAQAQLRVARHLPEPHHRPRPADRHLQACAQLPGVKKVLIGSGLRYDLAVKSPAYVKELVQHHVGGYLKIAPEHTEEGPLSKMMKPGIGSYDRFKQLFDKFSKEAGKEQFLIPYFIAAHPGTTDEDMLNLALWLKRNGFRADQVQAFYPSPMATATAMYHTGLNPLKGIHRDERAEPVDTVKGERRRRLHKAFLRWHDPANWPLLRQALKDMGRAELIGNGKQHLIPTWQPLGDGSYQSPRRKNSSAASEQPADPRPLPKSKRPAQAAPGRGRVSTQHTGLLPRAGGKGRSR